MKITHNVPASLHRFVDTGYTPLTHEQVWAEVQPDSEEQGLPFGKERAPEWLKMQILRTASVHLFTDRERLRNECLVETYTTNTAIQVLQSVMAENRTREKQRCRQVCADFRNLIDSNWISLLSKTQANRRYVQDCLDLIQQVEQNGYWHLVKLEQSYARLEGMVEGLRISQNYMMEKA